MFRKLFGKKNLGESDREDSGSNKRQPDDGGIVPNKSKTAALPKKTKRKPRPIKQQLGTLPKIGDFYQGIDAYGNVEGWKTTKSFKDSLLEDLISENLLHSVVSFLDVKDIVPMSTFNKRIQLGLKDTPLRLDNLKKLILTPLIMKVNNSVKFADGSEGPQWHVSGIITQVEIPQLFNILDPAKLKHLGVILRSQANISPIGELCQNLVQLDLQDCAELVDLSPLQSLTNLKALLIFKALKLTDITPLASLLNLRALNLRACEAIIDINPISACKGLKRLAITGNNNITNFTAIENFVSLEILDLSGCSKLKSLECLPDSDYMEVLVLAGCESLENVNWFEGRVNNLKMLKLNDCSKITDLSGLRGATELISLNISGLTELSSLGSIQSCFKLKHFESIKCSKLANMEEVFCNLTQLEAVRLESNVSLGSADGKSLLSCDKMIHLNVVGCKTIFLAQLLNSESIVLINAAKEAIKQTFNTRMITKFQKDEALALVESIFTGVDFANEAESQTTVLKMSKLTELMKEIKPIALGIMSSPSFSRLWKSIVSPKTPHLLKVKLLEFFQDSITFNRHSALKLVEEPSLFKSFLNLIDDDLLSFSNIGLVSIKIVAKFLDCLRRMIYESREYFPKNYDKSKENAVVDYKPSPLTVLHLMMQSVKDIETANIPNILMSILDNRDANKFYVTASFELLRNYIQIIGIVNDIVSERDKIANSINDDFVLESLVVSPVLVDKVVPILVKNLWQIDETLRLDAQTLLLLLVEEGGEKASQNLLLDPTFPHKLLEDLLLSAHKFLSNSKDNDLAKEATTRCIENATLLLKNLNISSFLGIFDKDSAALRLLIAMLEANNDLMQVCIRDENDPANVHCAENINKYMFIKHINLLLECIGHVINKPENVDKIYARAENLPGVVASLLHAASDQLEVFDNSVRLIIDMCKKSVIFCKKIQYLYTNSDVMIALRLFIDPKPQKRPRINKTLEQKTIGLKLLLILTDSQSFCNKFLDHNGNDMKTFEKQFRRFVFQVKANEGREDYEGIQSAAFLIGRLMSNKNNSPAKVRKLIQNYVSPLLDVLSKVVVDRRTITQLLIKEENQAIIFDEKAEKIARDRNDQPMSPLDFLLALTGQHLGGQRVSYQRDSSAVAKYIFAQEHGQNPQAVNTQEPNDETQRLVQMLSQSQNVDTNQVLTNDLTTESSLEQLQALNWSFRICCFLANLFSNGGYVALAVITKPVLNHVLWCLNSSNEFAEVKENVFRAVNILEGAAAHLLSTVVSQVLSPKGRKFVSIEGHDLHLQEEVEETNNQAPQNHAGLFHFLFTGSLVNHQDTAREQLEARKKAEAALVRSILTKQRQLRYVQSLCSSLKLKENKWESHIGEKEKNAKENLGSILDMPGNRALARVRRIIDQINVGGIAIEKSKQLIADNQIPYVTSSGFALLTTLCRVSALKNDPILSAELRKNPHIMQTLKQNFVFLLQNGDYVIDFVRLLTHDNQQLTFEFLSTLIRNFSICTDRTTENFCFLTSLYLLKILDQTTVEGRMLKRIMGSDNENGWKLPSSLASYLERISEELSNKETVIAENILLILGVLLEDNPLDLLKIFEASSESGLARFLVNTLIKVSGESMIAKVALSLVQGLSTVDDVSENKAVLVLSSKLLDEGLLEVLDKWKTDEGHSVQYENLSSHSRNLGLTAIYVAVAGETYNDFSISDKNLIEQTLIDWLAKNPEAKVAKALIKLDPALGAQDSDLLLKKFSGYELFEEALKREDHIIQTQKEEDDVVLERIRGFPHQMSLSSKYRVEFFKSKGTVAVNENYAASIGLSYFEITVIKDRLKLSALCIRPEGSIGVISKSFGKGILAGSLMNGINEVDPEKSCGYNIGDNVNHNDVIGVLVNVEKQYVKFFTNGRKPVKRNVSFLQNGYLPAASGRNIDFQFNLGNTPFLYYRKSWRSFKDSVNR